MMFCQIVPAFVVVAVALPMEDLDLMASVAEDNQFHGKR